MIKALRGMKDTLPGRVEIWQRIENDSKEILEKFGYREIRTPILEEKTLFVKAIGSDTDIVNKEMFAFQDRGARDVVMRPEGTAPIVRAYLEANLHKTEPFQKLYYIGPMFRAERPQAGRMRQFHQIGAEAIGSSSPAIDAEMILLASSILDKCGIVNYQIRLNNLGCHNDKTRLSQTIKENFSDKKNLLCDDCKKRLMINPLRILDCKEETCIRVVREGFKSIDFLCKSCKDHFEKVKSYLSATIGEGVIEDDPYIVRGLDYYTGTVFEISHPKMGAQDAIGAGGRYDNLIRDNGGPQLGAVGFALGIERMIMAMAQDAAVTGHEPLCLYIASMGEKALDKGFQILNDLRRADIRNKKGEVLKFDMDYEGKSLKAMMRNADKLGARFVLIIGDDELAKGEATLRDMRTKEQVGVKFKDITASIKEKAG